MAESRSRGGIASGTIRPARFVKRGADEGDVAEADAGEATIGISFNQTRRSDYVDTTAAPGIAALANEPISYYTAGAFCMLELAGTVAAGDFLKSDGDGKGVAASTDGDIYGAVAERDGASGELIPVEVRSGFRGA